MVLRWRWEPTAYDVPSTVDVRHMGGVSMYVTWAAFTGRGTIGIGPKVYLTLAPLNTRTAGQWEAEYGSIVETSMGWWVDLLL